jgi:hypothetical protein
MAQCGGNDSVVPTSQLDTTATISEPAIMPEKGDRPMRRQRHHGLFKRCDCATRSWPKCPHGYWIAFKWKGKRHQLSLDRELGKHIENKTDATAEAEGIRTAIRDGTFARSGERAATETAQPQETSQPYSVDKYVRDDFMPSAKLNLKASTIRFYEGNLDNHILPFIGSLPIIAVTRKQCRELIATARTKGLKIKTVRGIVRTLSTVLSQDVEDEHLPANPALSMRKYLRRGDEPEAAVDSFTRDEVTHVLRVAGEHFPQWYPWLLCGCGLACELVSCWRSSGATSIGMVATSLCSGIWCAIF